MCFNHQTCIPVWRRYMRGLLFFLCFIPLLYPAQSKAENKIIIGVGRDFYEGSKSRTFLHGSTNTWEGLTYLNQDLEAVPWLARSWESSSDGLEWTFYLRKGVRFHDGTPLTAKEVVASIERIRSHPRYDPTGNYRRVASVRARGDDAIAFTLNAPVPHFPKLVAYYSSPVIQPSCFDETGGVEKLVGTGPYQPVRISPDQEIVLSRFEGYWGPKAKYEKVVFKTIADSQTRLMALQAGDIDAIADVGGLLPEQLPQLESASQLAIKRVEVATTHVLLFNCGRPPFSDKGFRLWLSGTIDRKALVEAFTHGTGVVARDPYSRLCRPHAFGLIEPEAHAMPEIKPDQTPLLLLLHGGTLERWPYREMAQVIQALLSAHGLSAQIDIREPGGYHEAIKGGTFDLAIQPYTLMTGDPDFFYAYFIASTAPRNLGYQNPKADALIRAAREEMRPESRRTFYKRLQEILKQDMPLLPLYHDVSLYAHRKAVPGFEMDQLFRPILTQGPVWR